MSQKWFSFYIFYKNEKYKDVLIKHISEKMDIFIENLVIQKWFFIRYWDGGPSLRLRVLANPENINKIQGILNFVRQFIADHPNEEDFNRDMFLRNVKNFQEPGEKFVWHEDGEIIEVPYIAEIDRYGGIQSMSDTETMFQLSTELVIILLEKITSYPEKILLGYLLTRKLVEKFFSDPNFKQDIHFFLSKNIEFWEYKNILPSHKVVTFLKNNNNASEKILSVLNNDINIQEKLDKIQNKFQSIICNEAENEKIKYGYIAMSHIHMFNNRLGCSPFIEISYYKSIINGAQEHIKDK